MKQALVSAIQEIGGLEETNPSIVESDESFYNLEKKLNTLVHTNHFSSRFRARVDSALKADIDPLVRLLNTFAETLEVPDVEPQEVATLLLNHARAVHETPDDDDFWVKVHELMVSPIDDSGSEVAT